MVPGGFGQQHHMSDPEVLAFLADRGAKAKYVTSVCSDGSCSEPRAYSKATRRPRIGPRARVFAHSARSRSMRA